MEQKQICFLVFPKPSPSLCFVCQFLPGRPRTIQFSYSETKSEFKPPQLKAQGILLRISDTNLCWVGFFVNIVNRIFCNISSLFGRTSDAVFSFSLFPPSVCLSLSSPLRFSLYLLLLSCCIPTSCVNNSILSAVFIAVNVLSPPDSAGIVLPFSFFLLHSCLVCVLYVIRKLGVCTFCPPRCFKWVYLILSSGGS